MIVQYQSKLDKMIQDYEEIRKTFKWDYDLAKHLVALTYTMKNKMLNTEQIEEMKNYIKNKSGMLSNYRGNMLFILAGLLSATSDVPQRDFDRMLDTEKVLKKVGFKNGTYLPTAQYTLINVCDDNNVKYHVSRAKEIYQAMKKNHPILTGGDDYALAILLANTNHSTDILEAYYKELNSKGFRIGNGLQMLSHILAFSEKDIHSITSQCSRILETLRRNKLNIWPNYYAAIGVITLLDIDESVLITDLIELANYLKGIKRYRWLDKGMLVLIASAIITSEYISKKSENTLVDASLNVSIQAIIAAQQAAMIAAIAASAAAAGAAN